MNTPGPFMGGMTPSMRTPGTVMGDHIGAFTPLPGASGITPISPSYIVDSRTPMSPRGIISPAYENSPIYRP